MGFFHFSQNPRIVKIDGFIVYGIPSLNNNMTTVKTFFKLLEEDE